MSNYVRAHIDILELADLRAQLAEAEKVIEALEAIGNRNREGTPWPLDLKLRGTLAAYRTKYPRGSE